MKGRASVLINMSKCQERTDLRRWGRGGRAFTGVVLFTLPVEGAEEPPTRCTFKIN